MPEISRTLVKSAPELWAELSDAEALGRHLEAFGPLTITAAEAEQELRWEAEKACGTIRLEPSGFGTKVTLATELALAEPPAPAPEELGPPDQPAAEAPTEAIVAEAPARRGLFARLFRRKPPAVEAAVPPPPPEPEPEPPRPAPEPLIAPAEAEAALAAMLDALGTARHRPFSRA